MTTEQPRRDPVELSGQEKSLGLLAGVAIPIIWILADMSSRAGSGAFPILAPGTGHHLLAVITQGAASVLLLLWLVRRHGPIQTAVCLGAFAAAAVVSLLVPIAWPRTVSIPVLLLPIAVGLVYAWYAIRAGAWLARGPGAEGLIVTAVVVAAVLIGGPYLIESSVTADVDEAITVLRTGPDERVLEATAKLAKASHYPYRRGASARLSEACKTETNPQAQQRLTFALLALHWEQRATARTSSG